MSARALPAGRVAAVRLRPNLDLVEAIAAAATEAGFARAVVRSAVGSLVEAVIERPGGGPPARIPGPGVEIIALDGRIEPGPGGQPRAALHGVVSAPDKSVHGGRLVPGENAICITLEVVLQEVAEP